MGAGLGALLGGDLLDGLGAGSCVSLASCLRVGVGEAVDLGVGQRVGLGAGLGAGLGG